MGILTGFAILAEEVYELTVRNVEYVFQIVSQWLFFSLATES